jgi:16S rRNA (uracil1498-N3)-methyltransferase
MIIFYAPDILTNPILPEEESGHVVRVLRKRAGEEIVVVDGQGHRYTARIMDAHPKHCEVEILSAETLPFRPYQISLAVAPTKNLDRIEWMLEKCVEMGLERFTPLLCRFSERRELKLERLQRIAVSAMKQSLKAQLPELNPMTDIRTYIAEPFEGQKFIAHCMSDHERKLLSREIKPATPVRILIGPEGDFSDEEVSLALANGYVPVSLGNERLRTETASLAAVHTVHVINELRLD